MNGRGMTQNQRLKIFAEEACQDSGCLLYDLEVLGAGSNRVLRVYIDRDQESVSIQDCESVSRRLSEILDQNEDLMEGSYSLEVTSPGLERNLREPWHFMKAIGQNISIKSFAPFGDYVSHRPDLQKQRQMRGRLVEFNEAVGIKVEDNKGMVEIPVGQIAKAQTVFDMSVQKPGRR